MKNKKILIICIIIIFLIIGIFGSLYLKNVFIYKKIISIIDESKEKVSKINNVSISIEEFLNDEYSNAQGQIVVIKDLVQCDTNDRKYAEENNIDYRIINKKENVCYKVISSYNDKMIFIETANNEDFFTTELLKLLSIPKNDFFNSYKYSIEEEKIDSVECYKINIENDNSEIYEYHYWISKENGLLIKKEIQYLSNLDIEKNNVETSIYKYSFNTVTDEDIKTINLNDYSNYEIIDNRKI